MWEAIKSNPLLLLMFGIPIILITVGVILMNQDINEDQAAVNIKANAQAHSGKARAETKRQSDEIISAVASITEKGERMNAKRQGVDTSVQAPKETVAPAQENPLPAKTPTSSNVEEQQIEELPKVLSKSKKSKLKIRLDRARSRR